MGERVTGRVGSGQSAADSRGVRRTEHNPDSREEAQEAQTLVVMRSHSSMTNDHFSILNFQFTSRTLAWAVFYLAGYRW